MLLLWFIIKVNIVNYLLLIIIKKYIRYID